MISDRASSLNKGAKALDRLVLRISTKTSSFACHDRRSSRISILVGPGYTLVIVCSHNKSIPASLCPSSLSITSRVVQSTAVFSTVYSVACLMSVSSTNSSKQSLISISREEIDPHSYLLLLIKLQSSSIAKRSSLKRHYSLSYLNRWSRLVSSR